MEGFEDSRSDPKCDVSSRTIADGEDFDVFARVLSDSPDFEDDEDEAACMSILEELKADEVSAIAEASYSYWYVQRHLTPGRMISKDSKKNSALKEIQRHWIGEGRLKDKTVQALRQAIEYRNEHRITELRSLFTPKLEEHKLTNQDILNRKWIEEDLGRQLMVVRGSTNATSLSHNAEDSLLSSSRSAMVYKPPRGSPTDAAENDAYVVTQIYTAERAMACTEYLHGQICLAKDREREGGVPVAGGMASCRDGNAKLLVLFSFDGYQSRHSLTMTAMKTSSKVLQRLYPERLYKLIILEPPFWMRVLTTLMYPLLSADTVNKLQLVTGKTMTEEILHDLVGKYDQKSMEQILAGEFSTSVDLKRYLYDVPFHRLYDDVV